MPSFCIFKMASDVAVCTGSLCWTGVSVIENMLFHFVVFLFGVFCGLH